ncbi:MAG: hypothetical protein QME58_01460 [Bacteroidota bacterium]|nr:hypothetical protein [Bacteroidota bacterium]
MTCKEVKYQLPDFLKSRLSNKENQQIAEHLKLCLICEGELVSIETTFKKFDSENIPEPASTYWINLLPRIHSRIADTVKPKYAEWIVRTSIPVIALFFAVFFLSKVFLFDGSNIQQEVASNGNIQSFISSLNENEIADLELQFPSLNDNIYGSNDDRSMIKNLLDSTAASGSNGYLYQSLHSLDEKEIDDLLAILETN